MSPFAFAPVDPLRQGPLAAKSPVLGCSRRPVVLASTVGSAQNLGPTSDPFMFNVVFSKSIWNAATPDESSCFALVEREAVLPFPPTHEVKMFWGRDKPQAPTGIRWEFEKQRFYCSMADDFPHAVGPDHFDFEWLIANALAGGWRLIAKHNL
jgi:hypothetical protein